MQPNVSADPIFGDFIKVSPKSRALML